MEGAGPPMVNTDGTAYLEYEVRNTVNNVVTSDTLYLMQINPDNSSSSTILSATTQNETQYPGNIIPDGNGGVLATWSVSVVQGTQPTYPYEAVDVSGGAVGTPYNLPFSPQSVDITKQPDLVLGENGVAFASGMTTATVNGVQTQVSQIASFNISSGVPNWTYQAAPGDTLSIIEATDDGGVTINDFNNGVIQLSSVGDFNSDSRVVHSAASKNSSAPPPGTSSLPAGAVPFNLSTWVSPSSAGTTALFSPDGANGIPTVLAQNTYPQHHGNQHGQSSTPYCQQKNVSCALAPESDGLDPNPQHVQNRQVVYWLFNLQNGTLNALLPQNPPPVRIQEWEANSTNSSASICSWQTNNPDSMCESPNTTNNDGPGQLTDHMSAGLGGPFTVQQQFLVDRQGVQVFWPNSNGSWYGAWGTPQSSPPGFQPNQSTYTTAGWATITQIAPNTNAPTACPKECDTTLPQAGPPKQ